MKQGVSRAHADESAGFSGRAEGTPAAGRSNLSAERALDTVLLAAPVKGEVQPWVWLLRAVAERCGVQGAHAGISYLVRATILAPE
jgi:hypothetical protein